MSSSVKHPEIEVSLSEVTDGSEFFRIVTKVMRAMRKAGIPETEIKKFYKQAETGTHDKLVSTCGKWVTVN